jgi:mannose-6-phosphate isomerase-like protein (cupin superfamily)
MKILRRESSPRYKRDNIESFLIVSSKTCNANNLSFTLVEMGKDGVQNVHKHNPEQTYYIIEGSGLMTVGNEEQTVKAGDCIFIPSNENHGLKNTGGRILKYFSACSPSFTLAQCNELWPLNSLSALPYMRDGNEAD